MAKSYLDRVKATKARLKSRRGLLIRQGLQALNKKEQPIIISTAVAFSSEVIISEEAAPPLSFIWDSKTERDFTRLVDQDISSKTPPPAKGTS